MIHLLALHFLFCFLWILLGFHHMGSSDRKEETCDDDHRTGYGTVPNCVATVLLSFLCVNAL